jgi:chromate reductase
MHVVALVGSLRRRSYNRMTYDAAVSLAPADLTFEEADIGSLPLYDDDIRTEQGYPAGAARLRARIAAADAVLIVSPEYNFSLPGALKNALDWASRAPDQPFKGKPVAIMGASTSRFGTSRMQYHLRQMLVSLEALPLAKPEVMIPFAEKAFDADGRLVDGAARKAVSAQLEAFAAWARRLGAG